MIPVEIILLILSVHFVADFILQSDWQAKNKSVSNKALSLHVLTYTSVWAVVLSSAGAKGFLFAAINGFLHFLVDFVTSRVNKRLWSAGRTHDFFVGVGLDQLVHYICLFLSYILIFQ